MLEHSCLYSIYLLVMTEQAQLYMVVPFDRSIHSQRDRKEAIKKFQLAFSTRL